MMGLDFFLQKSESTALGPIELGAGPWSLYFTLLTVYFTQ